MSEVSKSRGSENLLRQRFLVDQIVADMAERAPDGWARIEAIMMPLGKIRAMNFEIYTVDGTDRGPGNISMPDTVMELRDVMYVEGRGTWFTLALTMWSSGEVSTRFDYENRPPYSRSIGHLMRDDLIAYPRDVLSQWMVDELARIEDEERDFREREAEPCFDAPEGKLLFAVEPVMDREAAREMARDYVPEEVDMYYVEIEYTERGEMEPVAAFIELDYESYEVRKVEYFPNGLVAHAEATYSGPVTAVSDDPFPSLEEAVDLPGVVAVQVISPERFQEEWLVAGGPDEF